MNNDTTTKNCAKNQKKSTKFFISNNLILVEADSKRKII